MSVSTDISGEPILILGLRDVKLLAMIFANGVSLKTAEQPKLVNRVFNFLDDPACIEWEEKHGSDL